MKKRKAIPNETRMIVNDRSGGNCEKCGEPLLYTKTRTLKKVGFDVWDDHKCWKCGKVGKVIDTPHMWLNNEKLGKIVNEKFPFFYKSYSKELRGSYFANHCPHCNMIQGDWYLNIWFLDMRSEGKEATTEYVEVPPSYEVIEKSFPHAIHHIYKNPSNNDLNNLLVVCIECHKSFHKKRK